MKLIPFDETQNIRGVAFPRQPTFRQFIITGPPGAGKSTLISRIRGWPQEGYIDLTQPGWWKARQLTFRPREVHLGFPVKGVDQAQTVFDDAWNEGGGLLELDPKRIRIPPEPQWFWSPRWRELYVFEFLLPPPEVLFERRRLRARHKTHAVDEFLAPDVVANQVDIFLATAEHLHNAGLRVYVRRDMDDLPLHFIDDSAGADPAEDPWSRLRVGWFRRLRQALRHQEEIPRVELDSQPRRLRRAVRLPRGQGPLVLDLNDTVYTLVPDRRLGTDAKAPCDWLLYAGAWGPDEAVVLRPFVRLAVGESLTVGRASETAALTPAPAEGLAARHLRVRNRRRGIVLEPQDPDARSQVFQVPAAGREAMAEQGQRTLRDLRALFGAPVDHLPPAAAEDLVARTLAVLADEPYRMPTAEGAPGTILDLPDGPVPVLVGDLHGQVDNLLTLLAQDSLLAALDQERACLVALGDALHLEEDDYLEDMESSVVMLDLLMTLKVRFPRSFFYLRGNHDSFSSDVGKGGVPQATLFRKHLRDLRGKPYTKQVAAFFDALPFIVRNGGYIACHAGPVGSEVPMAMLNTVHDYPGLMGELISTRLRGPSRPAGYRKRDVRAFRRSLGVERHTPFIVGHTPLTQGVGAWTHVRGILHHHIVHASDPRRFGVVTRVGTEMVVLEYRTAPMTALLAEAEAPAGSSATPAS